MTKAKEKLASEPESSEQRSTVRESADADQVISDTKVMLDAQPKVSIFVPLEPGEKPGTQLTGAINGYRWNVPKGVYVDVPQSIADIIKQSMDIYENNSATNMRLDNASAEKKAALNA